MNVSLRLVMGDKSSAEVGDESSAEVGDKSFAEVGDESSAEVDDESSAVPVPFCSEYTNSLQQSKITTLTFVPRFSNL